MRQGLYIALLFCSVVLKAQQQGLFSNYLLHQVVYNPAYIGSVPGREFNLAYRNQWAGFEGAPRTFAASGYGNFKKRNNLAAGGLAQSEKIGLIDYTSFYGLFSYKLKINETAAINFGMGAGAVQYSVRMFGARPYDRDDNFLASGVLNSTSFDASAGFYFYTPRFFLGFSNQHLTGSRIRWSNTDGKLTPHFYLYSGYNFDFGKKDEWRIQPSMMLRNNSPAPYTWEAQLKASYKQLVWISANYRSRISAGLTAGVCIDKQFTLSYAYDYALSSISAYVNGTHEVVLTYYIPLSRKKSKGEQILDADEEELKTTNGQGQPSLKGKKEGQPEEKKEEPK